MTLVGTPISHPNVIPTVETQLPGQIIRRPQVLAPWIDKLHNFLSVSHAFLERLFRVYHLMTSGGEGAMEISQSG